MGRRICAACLVLVLIATATSAQRGLKVVPADGKWVRQADLDHVGDYYALVIGIDTYREFAPLRCAARDASVLANLLKDDYGFRDVTLLLNGAATDKAIKEAIYALRKKVRPADSVLIYYAGHGTLEGKAGYWIPVNARRDTDTNYIMHAEVRAKISRDWMRARHVLVVADSCYAGALFRSASGPADVTPVYVQQALRTPSRQCLTSGGLYPVPDGTASGHSVFARYFLKALRNPPRNAFVPSDIFPALKYNVSRNAPRTHTGKPITPILGEIGECGHEFGGEFVFLRRRPAATGQPAPPEPVMPKPAPPKVPEPAVAPRVTAAQLAAARRAFYACRQADRSKYLNSGQKARKWEKYLADYESTGYEVAFAGERVGHWLGWTSGPELPRGWTSETRRTKVATPAGEQWKEIAYCKNTVGMEFVLIPAGEFVMGSEVGDVDEKPIHRVRITKSFYMGTCEVTQEEYEKVMGRNPSQFTSRRNPVEKVSWNNAVEFCTRLSQKEGATYRLPTEAEWEYACRAGTRSPFCFGEIISTDMANYNGDYAYGKGPKGVNRKRTVPAGSFQPNAFGLHDMHGNVWEWCGDFYAQDYYAKSPRQDPKGPPTGRLRMLRGGSWNYKPWFCRGGFHIGSPPNNVENDIGFRLVYDPNP